MKTIHDLNRETLSRMTHHRLHQTPFDDEAEWAEERADQIRDEIVEEYLEHGHTEYGRDSKRHWSPVDLVGEACGESDELVRELIKIARNPGACNNKALTSHALISYDRVADLIRGYLHSIVDEDEVAIAFDRRYG